MSANDRQINGTHYQGAIQTWDYIVSHDLGFLEGNVVKYVTRFRKKNGVQDLEKAKHYIEKLIEVENERLRRASSTDEQIDQPVTLVSAEAEQRHGIRIIRNVTYGDKTIGALPSRPKEEFGQPQDLGDIT